MNNKQVDIFDLLLRAFELRQYVNETLIYILLLEEYRQTDCDFNDKIEPEWMEASAEIAQTKHELLQYLINKF